MVMDRKSVKKYVYWGIFIAFVAGSIATGGPFNLIDLLVVRPIVNVLFVIFNWVHDFGLAIIIFTVLVKLLMLPLTKRQLDQAKLIRRIQPELTKIKENCKGNKQLESLQTMDLYRRYNVKPFASFVTLIIQLPIFVALFSAINVISVPRVNDNLMNRAYEIVAQPGTEIGTLEEKQQEYLKQLDEQGGNASGQSGANNGSESNNEGVNQDAGQNNVENGGEGRNSEMVDAHEVEYDFHPQLFGLVDLSTKPADVLMGKFSPSALVMLIFAVLASVVQYLVTRQQMPSGKADKSKKFRDLINEAKDGKELDEADISAMTTRQMSTMMPIMMFIVMFNLNGALVFYYLLSNIISLVQQRVILKKVSEEIDETTDKAVLKKLRQAQEAEVIENKKTGTKITRISAKDEKKKARGGAKKATKTTRITSGEKKGAKTGKKTTKAAGNKKRRKQ